MKIEIVNVVSVAMMIIEIIQNNQIIDTRDNQLFEEFLEDESSYRKK